MLYHELMQEERYLISAGSAQLRGVRAGSRGQASNGDGRRSRTATATNGGAVQADGTVAHRVRSWCACERTHTARWKSVPG